MSGVVGLIESYARRARDLTLTTNEVMQLVPRHRGRHRLLHPQPRRPRQQLRHADGSPLVDTVRYPSRKGWDATYGYGRINAYEMLKAVRDARIPPEAMIDGPSWFAVLPTSGTVPVTGHVAAPRRPPTTTACEWAPGLQPPAYPATDTWTSIGGRAPGSTAPSRRHARHARPRRRWPPPCPAAAPAHRSTPPTRTGPTRSASVSRIRVVVTAHGGRVRRRSRVRCQKQVFVHDDPDLVPGFPKPIPGASSVEPAVRRPDSATVARSCSSPRPTARVHAYRSRHGRAAGLPGGDRPSPWWPHRARRALPQRRQRQPGARVPPGRAGRRRPRRRRPPRGGRHRPRRQRVTSGPRRGSGFADVHVDPAYSRDDPAAQNAENRTKPGFASAPVVGRPDGDGRLEIVAASMDRHVYAWHGDGTPVAGFPVLLVDPATVPVGRPRDALGDVLALGPRAARAATWSPPRRSPTSTATVAPRSSSAAQEEYDEAPNIGDGADVLALLGVAGTPGNTRLYAISGKGTDAGPAPAGSTNPDAGAYLPGWPAKLSMLSTELLPTIGDGVVMPAAVGDVDPAHPGPEIVATSAAGTLYVLGADGTSVYGSTAAGDLPVLWAGGTGLAHADEFGAAAQLPGPGRVGRSGSVGHRVGELDGGGAKEIAAPDARAHPPARPQPRGAPAPQRRPGDRLERRDGQAALRLPPGDEPTSPSSSRRPSPTSTATVTTRSSPATACTRSTRSMPTGASPAGWPKLTGGWTIGTPAVGDWTGDGRNEVAQQRRDGVLLVWRTAGGASPAWASWGCDAYNSGACADTAAAPVTAPPTSTTTTTGRPRHVHPGDLGTGVDRRGGPRGERTECGRRHRRGPAHDRPRHRWSRAPGRGAHRRGRRPEHPPPSGQRVTCDRRRGAGVRRGHGASATGPT